MESVELCLAFFYKLIYVITFLMVYVHNKKGSCQSCSSTATFLTLKAKDSFFLGKAKYKILVPIN